PLEVTYLRCLCFAALPMLVMAAVNGFFSGHGQTWTVLGIEAFGTGVNVALAVPLVFGLGPIPEMGIAGAGWATVAGSWAAALLALGLFVRRRYRSEFNTLAGWRPERDLTRRLMVYGGPAGMQVRGRRGVPAGARGAGVGSRPGEAGGAGEVGRDRRTRPDAVGLRGGVLDRRRGEPDVRVRPAGRRRHQVRDRRHVRAGLADH